MRLWYSFVFFLFANALSHFLAPVRAHPRRLASPSASESGSVSISRPPDDLVPEVFPEVFPEVPTRGTDSAPLDALLAWRAEIDTATMACSAASADHNLAVLAKAATKANLNVSIAAHNAASDRESNMAARYSIATKRRRIACEQYFRLHGMIHSDGHSTASGLPSTVSMPPTPRGKCMDSDFHEDVFEGLSVELRTAGELSGEDSEGMDLA